MPTEPNKPTPNPDETPIDELMGWDQTEGEIPDLSDEDEKALDEAERKRDANRKGK